jgi:hypothetical protein
MPDLTELLLGFLLTTVLGGLLGYYFQNRAWRHQFRVQLLEAEQATATKLFEELSRLMDKRLYRMRQVHWNLKKEVPRGAIEEHMKRYRDVLYEWNDSLNRNLALTETYFGSGIRTHLEDTVYESFSRIGTALESRYRGTLAGEEPEGEKKASRDLSVLGSEIYRLNVSMIRSIQSRQAGLSRNEGEVATANLGAQPKASTGQ